MSLPGPLEPTRTVTFPSTGGATLYGEVYLPPRAPTAVAVMVHGYAEHCGRYREVAHVLVDAGLAVLGYDYRGHGRASGRRGHIDAWSDYHDDLDAAVAQARALAPGKPLVLVAHSNGSLITLRALTDGERRLDVAGAVLSSPFLGLKLQVPAAKIWLARGMSRVFPAFSQKNDLRVEDLTSDPERQAARTADTLCHDVASARWFTEAIGAQTHVLRQAANLSLPTLWLIGGDDPIADPAVSEPVARKVHGADVHLLRGFKHEVWNERERAHPLGLLGAFAAKLATT
ncbi:MAG: alpha/beta hydrolase [Kofleriaceae bacterium]|nr:alpha/beta hydrolase [Kofleriaceae bacterium]MCL4228399.1 alpha/beta hydrolase [Myxococcales bacterium]